MILSTLSMGFVLMSAMVSSAGRTCEKQIFHLHCTVCPAHWYQSCPKGGGGLVVEYKTWRSCGFLGWGCKTECVIKQKEDCNLPCGKPCPTTQRPTVRPTPAPSTPPSYNPSIAVRTAEELCRAKADELGLPFSTQGHSNGAPAGCIRYNDGRVIYVKSCNNHPNCGTTRCNGCRVLVASDGVDIEPAHVTSEKRCRVLATELGLPFSATHKSNGAPAGCVRYNDGRVIYVKTCINHPNCGTTRCNGCKFLDIEAIAVTKEERCEEKADELGLPFTTQHKSNGAPAGCVRYNDGRVIYVKTCTNHPNCGTSRCNGCSVLDISSVNLDAASVPLY